MAVNWDTRTADKCKIPTVKPEFCNGCRDLAYCTAQKARKQISIFDLLEEQEEEKEEILLKYFDGRGVFHQEKHLVPKNQVGAMRFIREWREANKGKYYFWGID